MYRQPAVWGALALGIASVLGGCAASRGDSPTVVILVRHADRVEGTDGLTQDGQLRARHLAHALEKAGITAVITSDAARATQTAAPIAAALGLTPMTFPGADVAAFVRAIAGQPPGGVVLVAGHSNTVPRIIAGLGGPQLPDIAATEFDDMYVLRLSPGRPAQLINLQYGSASPK